MKNTLEKEIKKIFCLMTEQTQKSNDSDVGIFSYLEKLISLGGIKKMDKERMVFNEYVKKLQIALVFLGFDLPKHGIDGLYSDETQQAIDLFNKKYGITNSNNAASVETLEKIKDELVKHINQKKTESNSYKSNLNNKDSVFSHFDLTTNDGFSKYAKLCDNFIRVKKHNHLNITGNMLANAAKKTLSKTGKYVPPELSLAQLTIEGGIGNPDKNIRPIRTKNPYNVGNIDDGSNVTYNNIEDAIGKYYNLMAVSYLSTKTPSEILSDFTNSRNNRYATDPNYENKVLNIARQANNLSKNIA